MADGTYLDHLAVAAERWEDLWPRYRRDLGGVWVSGDRSPGSGFGPAQLRFANNMKVEVLMPVRPEDNDFLRRFLDRRGPGPHHMTFKVPDIVAKMRDVEAAGYGLVGVDLRDPTWKEAFIHPKQGPGVVIQLAQALHDWSSPAPADLPDADRAAASLDYVAVGVTDLDQARALFVDLLDGTVESQGRDELFGVEYTSIAWSSGGVVRVFAADASGVHHAAFSLADPETLADAKPLPDGRYEVAADANLGVRLVLSAL